MTLSSMSDKNDKGSRKTKTKTRKIITDEPLTDATDFDKYSQTISNIISNSVPRFTVGIYGGWGTGKTTIMQMMRN